MRGWWLSLGIIVVIAIPSLIFAILGKSWASALGIGSWTTIWLVFAYTVFLATGVDVDPGNRAIGAFSDLSVRGFITLSIGAAFYLR